ncbi:MAG: hypothetical protein AB7P14_01860 [Blastocatellales bacterium]
MNERNGVSCEGGTQNFSVYETLGDGCRWIKRSRGWDGSTFDLMGKDQLAMS